MAELIYYLESNGIQYEAFPRSRLFIVFIITFCVIGALACVWVVTLQDRKFYGHISKSNIRLVVFIVVMFSIPSIVVCATKDQPETVRIHCTDEQFVELFKMGYKLRQGDNPDEWVCYGHGR